MDFIEVTINALKSTPMFTTGLTHA